MTWLAHVLGLDNGSGRWYLWWSGMGANLIAAIPLVGLMLSLTRRHNCHVKGCWRVGRHPIAGTTWTVCARHHPTGAPSAEDVRRTSP